VSQELALRGVAVLITAELEAFLRSLLQEHMDSIASRWEEMRPAQRMVVAAQVLLEMAPHVESGPEGIGDPKDAERVVRSLRRAASWVESPGQFARDGIDPRLNNFHDPANVAKTVERVLLLLREDGTPFFDWLGSHRIDQASYKLALRDLVHLRNEVAHQIGIGLRPTASELRVHQRRLARLVRCITYYTRGAQLLSAATATEAVPKGSASPAPIQGRG
jgi:hypothetical protein